MRQPLLSFLYVLYTAFLTLGPITSVQAEHHVLQIDQYSDQQLSGTYYQSEHTLTFQSTLIDQVQIYFNLAIDGQPLVGQYSLTQQNMELWIGDTALLEHAQKLLEKAAQALSHYLQANTYAIPPHAMVLMSLLDYWPDLFD